MITTHRSIFSTTIGGLLFCIGAMLACALTGCVTIEIEPDDNIVVVGPPPTQPEQPQPPTPPEEAWCGLESSFAETETPIFGEDWTNGHPFEANGGVGYTEVIRTPEWIGLFVNFYDDRNVFHQYFLSSRLLGFSFTDCSYYVSDVLVENRLVHVLFTAECWPSQEWFGSRFVGLSTIDVENGLDGINVLSPLQEEIYVNYQLALDGNDLVLGSYNVFSKQIGVRSLQRQAGFVFVGEEQIVSGSGSEQPFGRFISLESTDGLLTYRLANNEGVQTTRYRACDN